MISLVSHELRTPITPLKTSLQIISSGRAGEVTPNMAKFLGMANKNIESFSKIINDLLDMSKIEAGKMDYKFTSTNVEKLIEFVKLQQTNVAESKGLNLTTHFDEKFVTVFADSSRLQQVLNNLLSNAIKFTNTGGTIDISTKVVDASEIHVPECFAMKLKIWKASIFKFVSLMTELVLKKKTYQRFLINSNKWKALYHVKLVAQV